MTPLQMHRKKYAKGCDNSICEGAKNVVFVRGTLPCDVLFVGEAPGESEDSLGKPFVGPAGKLLDRIVADALDGTVLCMRCGAVCNETGLGFMCVNGHGGGTARTITWAFTNLIGCIPRDEDGRKSAAPDLAEIRQCSGRLQELIRLARPRLIVTVGALSDKYCPVSSGVSTVSITHPAAILRNSIAVQGLMIQKCVVVLRDAVEALDQPQQSARPGR